MMNQVPRTWCKSHSWLPLLLTLLITSAARAQTSSAPMEPSAPASDARPFLTELFSRYARATSYHLEYVEEHRMDGEFSRTWSKTVVTAIVGPEKQYRFERRGQFGTGVQVSDGKTEWIYFQPLNQFTQQPTPAAGPTQVHSSAAMRLGFLRESQNRVNSIAHWGALVRTATFAPDQAIDVNGKSVTCTVITTEGELPDMPGHVSVRFTFWIDKQSKLIRKTTDRMEGEVVPSEPNAQYLQVTDGLFTIAELDPPSFPDGTFIFTPPSSSILVKQFETKQTQELAKLVGKPAPAISLKGSEGKEVTLQSFQGKPVLLDFWATWCAPCVESLPALERLYQQNKEKGLVFLSLDEDDENPQKAIDFWAQHKEPWPNFHANRDIRDKFPLHGIPYFVVLDSSGKVTFSHAGLDESGLRAALDTLASPTSSQSTVTQ